MISLGITGGIACGKSLVGSFLAENGVAICEADVLAHEAMKVGTDVYDRIVATFGESVIGKAGEIDRRILGDLVFTDTEQLERLNGIVHPSVVKAWKAWLGEQVNRCEVAGVIVPLLYETANNAGWDAVVSVGSPEDQQVARLRERGLSESEIEARMNAQMSLEEKMQRADYVIFNAGTKELLKEQTNRILATILENKT